MLKPRLSAFIWTGGLILGAFVISMVGALAAELSQSVVWKIASLVLGLGWCVWGFTHVAKAHSRLLPWAWLIYLLLPLLMGLPLLPSVYARDLWALYHESDAQLITLDDLKHAEQVRWVKFESSIKVDTERYAVALGDRVMSYPRFGQSKPFYPEERVHALAQSKAEPDFEVMLSSPVFRYSDGSNAHVASRMFEVISIDDYPLKEQAAIMLYVQKWEVGALEQNKPRLLLLRPADENSHSTLVWLVIGMYALVAWIASAYVLGRSRKKRGNRMGSLI